MLSSMHTLGSCSSSRSHAAVVDRAANRHSCAPSCSSRCSSAAACKSRPQLQLCVRRQGSQPRRLQQQQARAADTQAPTEQLLEASAVLLERLTACEDYIQLAQLTEKHPDVLLHGPLNVYVLLQAARMRQLLEPEDLAPEQAAAHLHVMEQAEELIAAVADALVPVIPRLPLLTQGAVALALTQLQYYNADVLEAIAASVLSSLEADSVQQQQQQQQQQPGTPPSQSSSQTGDAGMEGPPAEALTQSFAELQPGSLPGVVLTLVAGFSLSGHYSEPLFNGLVNQVVQRPGAFTDVDNLVAICTALLDVQHYSPQLLQTAVATTFAQLPAVSSPTLVSLLLTLAFFRAGSSTSEFVAAALKELSSREGLQQQLDRKHTAQLWRACVLLLAHAGIVPPAGILQVLKAAGEGGELLLLAACPGATDAAMVQHLKDTVGELYAEWEAEGLLTPADMLGSLQQLGYGLQRQQRAGVAAYNPAASTRSSEEGGAEGSESAASSGQEQQQEQQQVPELDASWVSVPVDIALSGVDRQVAVMVLTSERYCLQPPARLRGTSALDISVLQALGWVVLPLPVREWEGLSSEDAKREYLAARMRAALG